MPLTLVKIDDAHVPEISARLVKLGRNTKAVETNIGCRLGMWYPNRSAATTQLALLYEPRRIMGKEFAQLTGRALTADHQRVWVEAMSEYLRAGNLEARAGSVSAAQLARTLGCELRRDGEVPSKVDARVRRLVRDLTEAQFRGSLRIFEKDSPQRLFTAEETLQLLDSPTWRQGPDGFSYLYFGVPAGLASLLHNVQQITFLHSPTWDAIRCDDELAALAWVMWEGERIPPTGWTYPVFSGAEGGIRDEALKQGLAEILHLGYGVRREAVRRLRQAIDCIIDHDPRYTGTTVVRDPRVSGMWHIRVLRSAHVATPENGLPRNVEGAWRDVYLGRRPSEDQRRVLCEVVGRRGAEWVGNALTVHRDTKDPFGSVLALDAATSKTRMAVARAAETQAAADKVREEQDAVGGLALLQQAAVRGQLLAAARAEFSQPDAEPAIAEASPLPHAAVPEAFDAVAIESQPPLPTTGGFEARLGDLIKSMGVPKSEDSAATFLGVQGRRVDRADAVRRESGEEARR